MNHHDPSAFTHMITRLTVFVVLYEGRIVALNMLNKTTELNSVPFYWTVLVGKTIRYTGECSHTHLTENLKASMTAFTCFCVSLLNVDPVQAMGRGTLRS